MKSVLLIVTIAALMWASSASAGTPMHVCIVPNTDRQRNWPGDSTRLTASSATSCTAADQLFYEVADGLTYSPYGGDVLPQYAYAKNHGRRIAVEVSTSPATAWFVTPTNFRTYNYALMAPANTILYVRCSLYDLMLWAWANYA